ncbi:hypothetical protein CN188_09410 [Sinorhizobium meliloti]|nr:hypothetical protein CN188_09410 [Sinorhizobium meliloti]
MNPIELEKGSISVDQRETKIDVSRDRGRYISDRSRPFHVTGTTFEVEIPFSGDAELFKVQPTSFTFNPPRGTVRGGSLFYTISGTDLDGAQVRASIDRFINDVESNLGTIRKDAASFNGSLRQVAMEKVEWRKQKLLKDRNTVAEIGFPLKRRDDVPATYVARDVQRKALPARPKPATTPFKPEPALSMEEYGNILQIMEGMVSVMEYSPHAFKNMGEEDLRTHFLVQLNGQYQGQATGETFNFEGKTDILIKSEGKNIFIAECKFWKGEKAFLATIDQLLSYLSWRDTKAAVLVFSRQKDFTNVCNTIRAATPTHPNCKKLIRERGETSYQYLFSHRDDQNREMLVTISAFNVPA